MTKLIFETILLFTFQSNTSLPTIEITSVDMDILTRFRIECSTFDQSFDRTEIKLKSIKEQKEIESFLAELKKLKMSDDRTLTDTRAQILIQYKDHADKICADRFSIYKNGASYVITDKLRKAIW